EVLELLAGELRVPAEVVVGAVVDALELVPSEGKRELDVGRRGGGVRPLGVRVVAKTELLFRDALVEMPRQARLLPLVVEPRRIGGAAEVLHLHLLELARPEDEVAWRDLVAEGLPDLRDPERKLLPRGLLDVLEV